MIALFASSVALAGALGAPEVWAQDDATQVVLVEDHRAPLVELRVQVPAGTWTPWLVENHGEEAWTLQHYDPDGALRARADALAIDLSVSTRQQRSLLSVSCLKRDLPDAIALVGDIFANDAYDAAELKRLQKGQDIGWEGSLKDPAFRTRKAAADLLFEEGDPRREDFTEPQKIETDSDVLAATRDAMLRLPGRVIGFGGDLTRDEAASLAASLLPEAVELPVELTPTFKPLAQRPMVFVEPMPNLTQVYFSYLREGPTWDDDDYVAWMLADHTLGGHFYSRLYVALRHDGGETYGAYTSGGGAAEPEVYSLSTFTRTDNKVTTEEKLRKTLQTFFDDGITQDELDEAVGYMAGQRLRSLQSPGQVLDEALWALGNDRPLDWEEQLIARARELTVDDVNATIKAFYDPEKFTMLTVEPEQ